MNYYLQNFSSEIIKLSKANTLKDAIAEWEFIHAEIEEPSNCPCGQDIVERCYIYNFITGKSTYVGNVCIKKFLKVDTGALFDGLKRILKNPDANPNNDVIRYAIERGYIYENEFQFLIDTKRKRKLTAKQKEWKRKINNRIINRIVVWKVEG